MTNPQAIPYARGREKLLTIPQVAERLNISRSSAYRLKDEGYLGQPIVIGRSVRITESAFFAYYQTRIEPSEAALAENQG